MLVIVEPNKVGHQHNTFNKEFLKLFKDLNIHFIADPSTLTLIDNLLYNTHENINVIDGESRRFIIKTLSEIYNILKICIKYRKHNILLLSISPQVLFIFEIIKLFLLPSQKIWINLHGELEGVFETKKQRINSYGFWIILWLKLRKVFQKINIVILSQYIFDSIKDKGYLIGKIDINTFIINLPIPIQRPLQDNIDKEVNNKDFLFIGQRSLKKGFQEFLSIQKKSKYNDGFYSIGQGRLIHHKTSGDEHHSFDDYLKSVAMFSVFIFPVLSGYKATISSALCDAVGSGLLILALRNPMTKYFNKILGDKFIILFDSKQDLVNYVDNLNLEEVRNTAPNRIRILNQSSFAFSNIEKKAIGSLGLNK